MSSNARRNLGNLRCTQIAVGTIRKRISAALLLILTLFIGTVMSFMIVYGNMRQEYDSIFNDVTSNIILIKDLSNAVHEQNLNIQGFVLTGRQQHLQALQTWRAKMLETLEELKTSIHDETLLQQLGTVRLMLAQYDRTLDFIVLVRHEKGIAAAERYLEYGDFLAKAEQEKETEAPRGPSSCRLRLVRSLQQVPRETLVS